MWPNIHNYIEAITDRYGSFRTLTSVSLPLNESGRPYMISGNFSVIFKVIVDDKPMALKCYIRRCHRSISDNQHIINYLTKLDSSESPFVRFALLESELYVFDDYGKGDWYPAVLMEWIEGETLGCAIKRALKMGNQSKLNSLAAEFDRMALWLKANRCAHGDLKFDNIVLSDNNRMLLVDYDGIFIPGLDTKYSCELGTHDFQHPLRDMLEFGEHTDDYSIVVISVTLHAAADYPDLFGEADWTTTPLFAERTITDYLTEQWLSLGKTHLVELVELLDSPTPDIEELTRLLSRLCSLRTQPNGKLKVFSHAGRFGYEDTEGEFSAPIFDMAEEFVGEYALVRFAERNLIIDKMCSVRIDFSQYKYVEMYKENVVRVSSDAVNWEFLELPL